MMKLRGMPQLWGTLLLSLTIVLGCSAQTPPQAPTDKLIKGPFKITTEWQTITFKKPLNTIPHVQLLELMLGDQYESVENDEMEDFDIIGHPFSFKRAKDIDVIKPELVLVSSKGYEFKPTVISSGFRNTGMGSYNLLSYGPDTDEGEFYYPKSLDIVAVKIKANIEVYVEYLSWHAPYYYQAPDDTWDDIKASEIVLLN